MNSTMQVTYSEEVDCTRTIGYEVKKKKSTALKNTKA